MVLLVVLVLVLVFVVVLLLVLVFAVAVFVLLAVILCLVPVFVDCSRFVSRLIPISRHSTGLAGSAGASPQRWVPQSLRCYGGMFQCSFLLTMCCRTFVFVVVIFVVVVKLLSSLL